MLNAFAKWDRPIELPAPRNSLVKEYGDKECNTALKTLSPPPGVPFIEDAFLWNHRRPSITLRATAWIFRIHVARRRFVHLDIAAALHFFFDAHHNGFQQQHAAARPDHHLRAGDEKAAPLPEDHLQSVNGG